MKIEVVSSDQMTLLQWCMNMYKGFCSFPISQKINKLSLGFALSLRRGSLLIFFLSNKCISHVALDNWFIRA
jgi:hypothetical protein